MAEQKLYRHIHIRGLGQASKNFRAPGGGPERHVKPITNRAAHAQLLKRELDEATGKIEAFLSEQNELGIPAPQRGMPMTILGRPNVDLQIGTGRPSAKQGLKVLNVRRSDAAKVEGDNEGPDQATFFVTKNSLNGLRRNLDQYSEWQPDPGHEVGFNEDEDEDDSKSGRRPTNFWLFESGAAIRETTLRDLWTDDVDDFPKDRTKVRWEVWTQVSLQKFFLEAAEKLGVKSFGRPTEFVETVVQSVIASPQDLQKLVRQSAAVVELRSASAFSSGFFNLEPGERMIAIDAIEKRIVWPPTDAPKVTILDTGVNRNNALLKKSLAASDCKAVEKGWDVSDHSGHGTKMAGLALFGDLEKVVQKPGPIVLETSLESIVVAAPAPPGDVPARDALKRAVDLVEKKPHRRVFCLAQTATGEAEDGRPTSTSAVLDNLAYNDGDATRLFCAAVGNVPHTVEQPYQLADYESRNVRFGIQSPAQAVNALAVGAVSMKDHGDEDLVAPVGDLMPSSRTACSWRRPRASKPDIMMEGGNFIVDDDGIFCRPSRKHFVLTTSNDAPARPLAMSGQTSTATALAAGLAARLAARYPNYRMETIRGLMVHSARWTRVMLDHAERLKSEGRKDTEVWESIIDRYGWGVPDEGRLFNSGSNALTMVMEDRLQPYERQQKNGKLQAIRLKEMKYFKLPWPSTILKDLDRTEVRMRCTLSYFVEPDPHAVTRDRIERYHSYRLKFDVKKFGESDQRAQARMNLLAEESGPSAKGPEEGWLMADRSMGTIVQDDWTGPAYRLADKAGISVVPIRGWWGDMANIDNYTRPARFSLIVSIQTPAEDGRDIVAEALLRVPANLLVEKVATLVAG